MPAQPFFITIDGKNVRIDAETQQVTILDLTGDVLFDEAIQVAAGSVQGLFSMLEGVSSGSVVNPIKQA